MPDFVAEVLSERTWRLDITVKPALYEALGVREFWILDVIDKLPEPVSGRCLNAAGEYEPITPTSDGALVSEVLGPELLDNDRNFRFRSANLRDPSRLHGVRRDAHGPGSQSHRG